TQLYIVDKYTNPTPIGVVGELCIAGVNVGQGYLNNETLTAEKFIDNPFGEGKLYKTGDLSFWREDGNICYVGRMDNQIKLNGQRIELGEIEKVISDVSGVESVAVMIKQNNGKDVLVAYCCGENLAKNEIKSICENKLPRYMIPSAIAIMKEMPLNANGKLDRKQLKSIDVVFDELVKEEPITETEKEICKLFEKILHIEFAGRNESFFALGGTSLDMISILSECELENVSAAEFIANPTPEKLAKFIDNNTFVETDGFHTLRLVKNSTRALIMLPYAGGDASAFANLTNDLAKIAPDLSLYYVDYLHSYDECFEVAEQIKKMSQTKEVNIYSHCVGAAVALQLINILENQGVSIANFITGGYIPPEKANEHNSWNRTPKWLIQRKLIKAGAPIEKLSTESKDSMVEKFRKDTDFMTEYFYKKVKPINVPTSVIISKTDIFTRNYEDAERLWKSVASAFVEVHYIEAQTHYFQSDESEKIAQIITKIIE
ncbi:MAG: AMP-binding protein, partial [Clostridia bacterium]|nr:AMP-binding protein [Clostridia bacterium]